MADGYDATQNGYGYIKTDIIQPDSRSALGDVMADTPRDVKVTWPDVTLNSHADTRDELRAYLVRYAQWAVCGVGMEPEQPQKLIARCKAPESTAGFTAPCLRDVGA